MKGRNRMEQENKEELTEDLKNMETKDLIKLLVKKMGYEFSKEKLQINHQRITKKKKKTYMRVI